MKQLLYILFIALVITGCVKKTDDLFEEPSDERVAKTLANLKAALMDAPGWKLFVYPAGLKGQDIEVGGLTYYITFPDSNRTLMVSDFVSSMAEVPNESSYRLKALQFPSLIFDTYSYMHVAADPDENISSSPTGGGGYGWGTDFEFGFTSTEVSDTIILKGNFNNSEAILIKVPEEEINIAFSGRLADIIDTTRFYSTNNPFLYFNAANSEKIGVSLNLYLYRINFSYLEAGQLVTISAPFSHTIDGLHFKDPVSVGGYTFQDAYWDDALELYYINTANGRVNIVNSSAPLFPFPAILGRSITTIAVPTTPLPGQSTTFGEVYDEVKDSLKLSGLNLDLDDMNFIFDDASKTMALQVFVTRDGGSFLCQYIFVYTINIATGVADFELVDANANGEAVINDVSPLLVYIDGDNFDMDYFISGVNILGQFTSIDNPDFFFTGTLQ